MKKTIEYNAAYINNKVVGFMLGLSIVSAIVACILTLWYADSNTQRSLGYLALTVLFLVCSIVVGSIPYEDESKYVGNVQLRTKKGLWYCYNNTLTYMSKQSGVKLEIYPNIPFIHNNPFKHGIKALFYYQAYRSSTLRSTSIEIPFIGVCYKRKKERR